ncbi:Cu,Zn superoxide dismutase-like protein [Terfezia boudieri ATCC MYA-4762]|uniref:superoxide dismutase n=1 Tax=Terfezia boudieri ATCC MYA-4762 TaxID=1051890 RepID=A0A3N4LNT1_9PEZI|nr:Cu,Zn superoxide dismutase-like protein [Terfezia boudieri ATCC MYA-4762]
MQIITKSAVAIVLFAATVFAADAPVEGDPTKITGAYGDAKAYSEQPVGKEYWADFTGTKLSGGVIFSPASGNRGVKVEVKLSGLPSEGGPFTYHIHDQPVPADGNCTRTLAHLDPFIRGQKVPCDPSRPQSCEVGDLAGKHGKIPTDTNGTYTKTYDDLYFTLTQGEGSFIGNRSVVVHTNDTKRYACANIKDFRSSNSDSSGNRFGKGIWGCGLGVAVGLKFLLV